MSDDTTDVSEKTQELVVFRNENEGTVHERFWGFYNPNSQDAEGLPEYVLEQLGVVFKGDFGKLIAQTYDGTAVMSERKVEYKPCLRKHKKCSFYSLLCASVTFNNRKRSIKKIQKCVFFY
jgi:hypothetical protein